MSGSSTATPKRNRSSSKSANGTREKSWRDLSREELLASTPPSPVHHRADDDEYKYNMTLDTFAYTESSKISPLPPSMRDVENESEDSDDPDIIAANKIVASAGIEVKHHPKETLMETLPALILGVALALIVESFVMRLEDVRNLDHTSMPLMRSCPYSLPIGAVVLYVIFVHGFGPYYHRHVYPRLAADKETKEAFDRYMKLALRVWNLSLAFISLCMGLGMGIALFKFALQSNFNLWVNICDRTKTRQRQPFYYWLYIFALSKFAELIDTVFLVLRKRPVSFLHWYHHVTVLIYTWFAVMWHFQPGYYFASINCGVHTIMYWYYYRRACGVKLSYDKLITRIQITQMVVGLSITVLWFVFRLLDPENCPDPTKGVEFLVGYAAVMYASYFWLFFSLYRQRYRRQQAERKAQLKFEAEAAAAAVAANGKDGKKDD